MTTMRQEDKVAGAGEGRTENGEHRGGVSIGVCRRRYDHAAFVQIKYEKIVVGLRTHINVFCMCFLSYCSNLKP